MSCAAGFNWIRHRLRIEESGEVCAHHRDELNDLIALAARVRQNRLYSSRVLPVRVDARGQLARSLVAAGNEGVAQEPTP
jgi:hypothetical protein